MVEYAVGVALVALALIVTIGFLRDSSSDEFDSSVGLTYDAGSAPTVPTTGNPPTSVPPPTTAPPTTAPPTTAPPPTGDANITGSFSQGTPASKWNATITITVTNGGAPFPGVTVTGSWDIGGTPNSCITDASGQCSFTRTDINDNTPSATWTYTSMSGATQGTVSGSPRTVSCPNPATCD